MKTKIPKRVLMEAKGRLRKAGFSDDSALDKIAKVALTEPIETLESFGCKIIFPRTIPEL